MDPHAVDRQRQHRSGAGSVRGFTLIELIVVIIILAVLAAVALPKFTSLGREARIASVKSMSGTLWSAANMVHAACGLSPGCDYNTYQQIVTINGRSADVDYGWPNGGDSLGTNQIDVWITQDGFTVTLPDGYFHTSYSLDSAPDPANCAAIYGDITTSPDGRTPTVVTVTSGC